MTRVRGFLPFSSCHIQNMRNKIILSAAALFLALTSTTTAEAQVRNQISVEPIGIVFGGLGAEYSHAVTENGAVAVDANHGSFFGLGISSLNVKYRLYMGGEAFKGFAIAPRAGLMNFSYQDEECWESCGSESAKALTTGVELSYSWLLSDKWTVSPMLGAYRLFPMGTEVDGVSVALPTAGLSVGYVF